MSVLDLAYDRIDKKLEELEATDDYFRGMRVGLIDALELIDILDMELDGRLPAGDDVREHLNLPPEPEPDWLDAPAVIATTIGNDNHRTFMNVGNSRWRTIGEKSYHWNELTEVTPLYPKERAGSVAPLYPEGNRDE